ncbi:hypothetical protein KC333_g3980 [Hortaea werneckii]|nr:hypothetical protein KC333_g3980 [Hortaea werneckii]KAI7316899.1 hypothetical protein KC326_g4220 [Hortaea werneckii]
MAGHWLDCVVLPHNVFGGAGTNCACSYDFALFFSPTRDLFTLSTIVLAQALLEPGVVRPMMPGLLHKNPFRLQGSAIEPGAGRGSAIEFKQFKAAREGLVF